jgi:hypothetical protein
MEEVHDGQSNPAAAARGSGDPRVNARPIRMTTWPALANSATVTVWPLGRYLTPFQEAMRVVNGPGLTMRAGPASDHEKNVQIV